MEAVANQANSSLTSQGAWARDGRALIVVIELEARQIRSEPKQAFH